MTDIQKALYAFQDLSFRAFQCRLMPTVPPETVIGVRMPALHAVVQKINNTPQAARFLQELPHQYYEENNLHALLIGQIDDFDQAIAALDTFLPFVDNWSTCDIKPPDILSRHPQRLFLQIKAWISSPHEYAVRYAVGLLMRFYLDDLFDASHLTLVFQIQRDEYYINMMIAWYFATALVKQYDAALPFLTEKRLPVWIHNKAIQKAIESTRIPTRQKLFLRKLRYKAPKQNC